MCRGIVRCALACARLPWLSVTGICDQFGHNVTKFASISHGSTLGSFVTAVGFWRWCHRSCTTQMDPADGSRAVSAEIRRFCGAPGWTTEGVRASKHQKEGLLVLSDASLAWPPAEQGGACGSRCGRGGHHSWPPRTGHRHGASTRSRTRLPEGECQRTPPARYTSTFFCK